MKLCGSGGLLSIFRLEMSGCWVPNGEGRVHLLVADQRRLGKSGSCGPATESMGLGSLGSVARCQSRAHSAPVLRRSDWNRFLDRQKLNEGEGYGHVVTCETKREQTNKQTNEQTNKQRCTTDAEKQRNRDSEIQSYLQASMHAS